MKKCHALLLFAGFLAATCTQKNVEKAAISTENDPKTRPKWALAIHGGAGAIPKSEMTATKDSAYRAGLEAALEAGETVLKNGGSALDAVEKAIRSLEDCPLFNAGKGAVFTHEGRNELDASIMNGADQKAGAVASVMVLKNPISAARAVMEKSPHVFLVGRGAEDFAREQGLETVDPSYFFTQNRWDAHQKMLQDEQTAKKTGRVFEPEKRSLFGTVGCVALDQNGHLAAGTSTGGMTNKRWNRLGDAPVIGAGTYADDTAAAISCTGHGEFFIRYAVAHDIVARMIYGQKSLENACSDVLKKLTEKGAEGGFIAIDRDGNIRQLFNSEGMYRGIARPEGHETAIY